MIIRLGQSGFSPNLTHINLHIKYYYKAIQKGYNVDDYVESGVFFISKYILLEYSKTS